MSYKKEEASRMKSLWAKEFDSGSLLPSGIQLDGIPRNLAPEIRDFALAYFAQYGIAWHIHANHALSSQIACVNMLMPLARRPRLLGELIGAVLGREAPNMLPVEPGPDGQPVYVGFEWIGRADYLNEWSSGKATRGANVTSTDAIVRFEGDQGPETLLIEWKYTETYASATERWQNGNATRRQRYAAKAFAPDGPVRAELDLDVEDFFHEPIYQMLRQTMLAWQMQKHGEDGATRVRVLHVSPRGNTVLHRMTAPKLPTGDAFEVFRSLLVDPDIFMQTTTEALFSSLLASEPDDSDVRAWLTYARERYSFLENEIPETRPA